MCELFLATYIDYYSTQTAVHYSSHFKVCSKIIFFCNGSNKDKVIYSTKIKIIEESKKSGFKREKILIEYGIGKTTLHISFAKKSETNQNHRNVSN